MYDITAKQFAIDNAGRECEYAYVAGVEEARCDIRIIGYMGNWIVVESATKGKSFVDWNFTPVANHIIFKGFACDLKSIKFKDEEINKDSSISAYL